MKRFIVGLVSLFALAGCQVAPSSRPVTRPEPVAKVVKDDRWLKSQAESIERELETALKPKMQRARELQDLVLILGEIIGVIAQKDAKSISKEENKIGLEALIDMERAYEEIKNLLIACTDFYLEADESMKTLIGQLYGAEVSLRNRSGCVAVLQKWRKDRMLQFLEVVESAEKAEAQRELIVREKAQYLRHHRRE